MSSLPDTQTPDVLSLTPNTKANIIKPIKVWGRLYSTYIYLAPVDLKTSTFRLGRSQECDVVITESTVPLHRVIAISKTHFIITRIDNIAYIEDVSKNGTFLNGKLIGKGRTNILQNDDEISIGFKALKIYIFKVLSDLQGNNELPPKLRQRYQLSKLLGRGACGEVKMAFEKETLKAYAVKKIMKAKSHCGQNKLNRPETIEREINILKALDHPCIIQMFEIDETSDHVFMVLEYMGGGELTELVCTTHPINEAESKFIFYQILLAVQYLHSHGVIHRDLKPENVLLKESKAKTVVKISDFGLSRIIDGDDGEKKTVCGTPLYVAPEIISRLPYSFPADIWSLGVMLFYMLAQEMPFDTSGDRNLSDCIRKGAIVFDPVVWARISYQARDLVEQMLTVDPLNRIKLCDVLNHPWIHEDAQMLDEVDQMLYRQSSTLVVATDSFESSFTTDGDSDEPPTKRSRISNE